YTVDTEGFCSQQNRIMATAENALSSRSKHPRHRPMTSQATSRYLTNTEAAQFLRLSPRTLEKQRILGGGPRYRKFGRRVRYAIDELEGWANQRGHEM